MSETAAYRGGGDGLCDAEAICFHLARLKLSVRPGTLRVWALRGHIKVHGRDRFGRSLYDYNEVATHAENRRSGRRPADPVTSTAALSVPENG